MSNVSHHQPHAANKLMHRFLALLCVCCLVSGCSSTNDTYQVKEKTVEGQAQGSRLIETSGNETIAAQTADGNRAPKLIKAIAPRMPREAIARDIYGNVEAQLQVDPDGKVTSVNILRSPHPMLSEAVIKAMSQWIFSPLLVNGTPKSFAVRQTYFFRIEP